jgi:hypothetical protein
LLNYDAGCTNATFSYFLVLVIVGEAAVGTLDFMRFVVRVLKIGLGRVGGALCRILSWL